MISWDERQFQISLCCVMNDGLLRFSWIFWVNWVSGPNGALLFTFDAFLNTENTMRLFFFNFKPSEWLVLKLFQSTVQFLVISSVVLLGLGYTYRGKSSVILIWVIGIRGSQFWASEMRISISCGWFMHVWISEVGRDFIWVQIVKNSFTSTDLLFLSSALHTHNFFCESWGESRELER